MAEQCDEDKEDNLFEGFNGKSAMLSKSNINSTGDTTSNTFPQSTTSHAPEQGFKSLAVLCILLTELCEHMAYNGLTANLLLFCSEFLELDSPWPSSIMYLFQGTCCIISIFSGWLADSYMGRFNVLFGSDLLYFVGLVLLTVVSIRQHQFANLFGKGADLGETGRFLYFSLSLMITAFGIGGVRANSTPFGADQVQLAGPAAVERFFTWFYWLINVGSLASFTVIVYIQQKYDFVYGYIITACTMLLVLMLFVTGRNKYCHKEPRGSQLRDAVNIIRQAIKNRKIAVGNKVTSWLDHAKQRFGGTYSEMPVEDVKALFRLISVFVIFIIYRMIYNQGQTTYLLQATYLRLTFNNFEVPAASLAVVNVVIILVLLPFMDNVVYPILRSWGIRCSPFQRIAVGLLLAASSAIAAGLLEIKRKNDINAGHFINQTVFNRARNASSVNIFYQVPQCLLMGASEVLANVTGLEFAYSQAPIHLKGLVMGCYMITSALGSYATLLLVILVRTIDITWYPSNNPNQGKMEIFFFILAGLMVVNFFAFLRVTSFYDYKNPVGREQEAKREQRTGQPQYDNE